MDSNPADFAILQPGVVVFRANTDTSGPEVYVS